MREDIYLTKSWPPSSTKLISNNLDLWVHKETKPKLLNSFDVKKNMSPISFNNSNSIYWLKPEVLQVKAGLLLWSKWVGNCIQTAFGGTEVGTMTILPPHTALGVVHKLRWHVFGFLTTYILRLHFLPYKVWYFWTPYQPLLPRLVNVVCEPPLIALLTYLRTYSPPKCIISDKIGHCASKKFFWDLIALCVILDILMWGPHKISH